MDQLHFDFSTEIDRLTWPDQERFPLNIHRVNRRITVEHVLIKDIRNSNYYLIITGFTSLGYLVDVLGRIPQEDFPKVHVVLGNEPASDSTFHPSTVPIPFPEEIRRYWLSRGFSLLLNGPLIRVIETIDCGKLSFSEHKDLHAKLYISDSYAVLGSSNFSRSGMVFQKEANIRIKHTQKRYKEIQQIAENFREKSFDCTGKIRELLEQMLQYVSWKEALSRAVSELLEGEWIKRYPSFFALEKNERLWPSQRQALAQALYILDTMGSVLIADPTGSGKTKVGTNLLYSLINRKWKTVSFGIPSAVVIAPPLIQESCWKKEGGRKIESFITLLSSGILSSRRSDQYRNAVDALKNATILLIDEAHNFLNSRSARSRTIANTIADHVILSTATPINRRVTDLFRLIEILGLDNLSNEILHLYSSYRYKRYFSEHELEELRKYVKKFTVRRTKREIHSMIEANPTEYISRLSRQCNYPEHICKVYNTGETEDDKRNAKTIDEIASGLRGLLFLRNISSFFSTPGTAEDIQRTVDRTMRAAKSLAVYNIRSMLRSSRAALIEHIEGTEEALASCNLHGFRHEIDKSGNVLKTLSEHAKTLPHIGVGFAGASTNPSIPKQAGVPINEGTPTNADIPRQANSTGGFPPWLTDLQRYREACAEEIERYKKIAEITKSLSNTREKTKAATIQKLARKHSKIIVYDNRIITLYYIYHLLQRKRKKLNTYIITGGVGKRKKQTITSLFDLESREENAIALCSDAMAEGVNFQAASAVLFLDLPSVIRLAEQRVGRVDRLDSPHRRIEVYWPDDSNAFSLRTDRRFVERHFMVSKVLGANMPIPEEFLTDYQEEQIHSSQLIKLFKEKEQEEQAWDGIEDAFKPVRELIGGEEPVIPPKQYAQLKKTVAETESTVSCVASSTFWAFLALQGSGNRAPQWLFITERLEVVGDLSQICSLLRQYLPASRDIRWEGQAGEFLSRAIGNIKRFEQKSLPIKRRRALAQMTKVCSAYLRESEQDPKRRSIITALLTVLRDEDGQYDLYQLAGNWIEVIKPSMIAFQEANERNRAVRLKHITPYLIEYKLPNEKLEYLLGKTVRLKPIEERTASCIIGVPEQPKEPLS